MAELKVKLSELKDSEINPRTHPGPQMRALMASMRRFGFAGVILVDEENTILAGHARAEAARRLGMTEVPARRITGLNEGEKRDYVVRDNRLGEMGTWDTDRLADDLEALQAQDFDMGDFGFSVLPVPTEAAAASEEAEKNAVDDLASGDDGPTGEEDLAPPVEPGAGVSGGPPAEQGAPVIDPDADNRTRGEAAPPEDAGPDDEDGDDAPEAEGAPDTLAEGEDQEVMCPECGHSWAPEVPEDTEDE